VAEESGRWWKFGASVFHLPQEIRSIAFSLLMSPTAVRTRIRPDINIPHTFYG